MSMPIWMALPPEVSSSLLTDGPGPGALVAAADAWAALSTEYQSAADELVGLLGEVQAGAWQGPSAEQYVAAHVPYLNWLVGTAAEAAATAAAHETAVAAYTGAVAAMPSMAEITANHAVHTALLATNFFGINTIPIAVNEADYARMWMQAAATMTAYESTSEAAVSTMPTTTTAPTILAVDAAPTDTGSDSTGQLDDFLNNWQDELAALIQQYTDNFAWPVSVDLNPEGFPVDAMGFVNGLKPVLSAVFPFLNPTLVSTLAWATFHTAMVIYPLAQTGIQVAAVGALVAAGPAAAVLAAAGGTATALGVVAVAVPHPVVAAPAAPLPAVGASPAVVTSSASPTVLAGTQPGVFHAPGSGAAASVTAHPSGPPQGGGGPAVGAGPSIYAVGAARAQDSVHTGARRSSSARAAAPADSARAEAAATSADRARARRRKRTQMQEHGFRYEYLDPEPGDAAVASERGAGVLGQGGVPAPAGITTVTDDAFGRGARAPMLPGSWQPN